MLAVGATTLLDDALNRGRAVADGGRVCVIVADHHHRWWCEALLGLGSANVIVQPSSRGTAIGILLPLLEILARDRLARIVVLPSDHFVRDEAGLARSLRLAASLPPARHRSRADPGPEADRSFCCRVGY